MSQSDKIEEKRKELLARGAFEIVEGEGGGFAQHEEEFVNPGLVQYLKTDPKLLSELIDIEKRTHDARPSQINFEAAKAMFEQNMATEAVRECQWLRQDEVTSFVPGRMMTSNEFLGLLRKIRPDAFYNDYVILGRRGLNVVNPLRLKPYFVTTVQNGQMIEWTQMRTDEHNIPTNEKYKGWRAVLMTLIEREIISIEQGDAVFGKPTGERSNRWYRTLSIMRNARCPDCLKQLCTCKTFGDSLRADNYAYEKIK